MDAERGAGAVLTIIRTVAETGSTNADLLALARNGSAQEGTWLRAERQQTGRGRQGRLWHSPEGNLYASTVVQLRPHDPAAAGLAMVAAVAIEETVGVFLDPAGWTGQRVLKWPNDLLLDHAKVSGILLERVGPVVVVGIGVNLQHHPKLEDRVATSLSAHGVSVAPDAFLTVLAESFARWLAGWRAQGLEPVRLRWLSRAHPRGTALSARLPDGQVLDGLFDGLDAHGALLLRLASGDRHVIHAGDVFHL